MNTAISALSPKWTIIVRSYCSVNSCYSNCSNSWISRPSIVVLKSTFWLRYEFPTPPVYTVGWQTHHRQIKIQSSADALQKSRACFKGRLIRTVTLFTTKVEGDFNNTVTAITMTCLDLRKLSKKLGLFWAACNVYYHHDPIIVYRYYVVTRNQPIMTRPSNSAPVCNQGL